MDLKEYRIGIRVKYPDSISSIMDGSMPLQIFSLLDDAHITIRGDMEHVEKVEFIVANFDKDCWVCEYSRQIAKMRNTTSNTCGKNLKIEGNVHRQDKRLFH